MNNPNRFRSPIVGGIPKTQARNAAQAAVGMGKVMQRAYAVCLRGIGGPAGIRTLDTRIKSPSLYHAELQAH